MTYTNPPGFLWSDVIGTTEAKQSLVSKLNLLSADVADLQATRIGLGTLATQNADAVAITGGTITGGTINNATIGATTPKTAVFSPSIDIVPTAPTGTAFIRVAPGRADNGASTIDLIGDATYTSYGLRIIRSAGANAASSFLHRGTGVLAFNAADAGSVQFATSNTVRMTVSSSGVLTLAGDLQHNGTNLGFYGVTAVGRPAAYTQTYTTATRTHAALTASNPPAGGTGATAGAYDTAAHRDAMITSLTNLIADVANVKQVVNSLIDDLQANGLLQ